MNAIYVAYLKQSRHILASHERERESEHLGVSMSSSQGKSWVLFVWVKVMRCLAQMVEIPEWIQLLLMIIIMVDVLV